jgi:mannose-6-phosphate isomerase-like protein (cupin superfamily)
MSIPPGGDIGEEVHDDVDQTLVFVQGEGQAILDGKKSAVAVNRLVRVPAGTRHNFVNTGKADLRQRGRVLILADGIRPDHYYRRTSGFTPEH